jgi:hypothetical protein
MVAFIKQEANEKAHEILIKAGAIWGSTCKSQSALFHLTINAETVFIVSSGRCLKRHLAFHACNRLLLSQMVGALKFCARVDWFSAFKVQDIL